MPLGASGVTTTILKSGVLAPVLAAFPTLAGFPDTELDAAIGQAEALVAQELGIRWGPTLVSCYFGASPQAAVSQWDPAAPTVDGVEFEPAYDWPGRIPGDGFIRIAPRLRPIIEVVSITLNIPGAVISSFPIPQGWLRVDRPAHQILVAPSGGSALYALAFGQGAMNFRMPGATQLTYRAGLLPGDLDPGGYWSPVRRLVQITAALQAFPILSLWANPGNLTSESADGLSQSRGSAYVFKDLQDQLGTEAEALKARIQNLIEGPGLFFL